MNENSTQVENSNSRVVNSDYDSFVDSLPPSLRLKVVRHFADQEDGATGVGVPPSETGPGATRAAQSGWFRAIALIVVSVLIAALWVVSMAGRVAFIAMENLKEYVRENYEA